MTAFRPLGEKARWVMVYEILRRHDVGDTITYPELAARLSLHPDDDRHAIQMAVRRAAKEYLLMDQHALDAIPNVGYRIVEAIEHMRLAQVQQRRSSRALDQGHRQVTHVDLTDVHPEAVKLFDLMAAAFSRQTQYNRMFDVRQKRLEQAMAAAVTHSEFTVTKEETQQMLEKLNARIAQLEANSGPQ